MAAHSNVIDSDGSHVIFTNVRAGRRTPKLGEVETLSNVSYKSTRSESETGASQAPTDKGIPPCDGEGSSALKAHSSDSLDPSDSSAGLVKRFSSRQNCNPDRNEEKRKGSQLSATGSDRDLDKASKIALMPWNEYKARIDAVAPRSSPSIAAPGKIFQGRHQRSNRRRRGEGNDGKGEMQGLQPTVDAYNHGARDSEGADKPGEVSSYIHRSVSGPEFFQSGPELSHRFASMDDYGAAPDMKMSTSWNEMIEVSDLGPNLDSPRSLSNARKSTEEDEKFVADQLWRQATIGSVGSDSEDQWGDRAKHLQDIVLGMLDDPNNGDVQENGLRALQNIAVGRRQQEMATKAGAARAAVGALSSFPEDSSIRTLSLQLLADLCSGNHQARAFVGGCQGIEAIVAVLKHSESTGNSKATAAALGTLRECCRESEDSQDTAGKTGAFEIVLRIMRKQKGRHAMQLRCLNVLEALTKENEANRQIVRDSGGVEEVLSCMRNFRTSDRIQELASELLAIFACDHHETQISIGANGGIADVLHAFRLAKDSESGTEAACECLRYLAFERENRLRVVQAYGVQELMERAEWMKAAPVETTRAILLALGNVTFDDFGGKSQAAKNGGVSTLVSIMAIHEEDVPIIEYACRVLRNISDSKQAVRRLCFKQGAVAAVAAMMKKHLSSARVQEHGAAMLINMMNEFQHTVRSAKLEYHLETVCDVHSLCEQTFEQAHYLHSELTRRSNGLTAFLGRRFTTQLSKDSVGPTLAGANASSFSSAYLGERQMLSNSESRPEMYSSRDDGDFWRDETHRHDVQNSVSHAASRDSGKARGSKRPSQASNHSSCATGVGNDYPESYAGTVDHPLGEDEHIEY